MKRWHKKNDEYYKKQEERTIRLAKEGKKYEGRPMIKLDSLPENWQQTILDMMKQGASQIEVMAELGISSRTWTRMVDREPELAELIAQGKELSEAWWMNEARKNLYNGRFQTVLWYMNMKNRFGWKDKSEVDYTSGGKAIMPQIMIFGSLDPLAKKIRQIKAEEPLRIAEGTEGETDIKND